jgi:MFS family permease
MNSIDFLRNKNFLRFYLAQAVSALGDWVSYIAIPLFVYNITKDPISIAILMFCKFIPNIIISPYIGKLINKFNSFKLMGLADFMRGVAFLGYLFTDNTFIIYSITLIIYTFSAIFNPIKFNVIPEIVTQDKLTQANAHIGGISKLMMLIGPSIGGILFSLFGKEVIIILNSLSFFISLYFILRIRIFKENTNRFLLSDDSVNKSYLKSILKMRRKNSKGFVFIFLSSVVNCTFGALNTLFPMVSANFKNSSALYGYIISILGLGLFIGTFITPYLLKNKKYLDIYSYSTIFAAIFLFIFGNATNSILILVMVLGFSIGNGVQEISEVTYIQDICKEDSIELFALSQALTSILVLISTSFAAILAKCYGIKLTIVLLSK